MIYDRVIAREVRFQNVRLDRIDTPIIDGQFKTKAEAGGARAMFAQMTPLGRIG